MTTTTLPKRDEIQKYLRGAIEMAVESDDYRHSQLPELQKNILDYASKKIATTLADGSFKTIVTCTAIQNTGSGLHTSNTLHLDEDKDLVVSHVFQNDSVIIEVNAFLLSTD